MPFRTSLSVYISLLFLVLIFHILDPKWIKASCLSYWMYTYTTQSLKSCYYSRSILDCIIRDRLLIDHIFSILFWEGHYGRLGYLMPYLIIKSFILYLWNLKGAKQKGERSPLWFRKQNWSLKPLIALFLSMMMMIVIATANIYWAHCFEYFDWCYLILTTIL